MVNLQSTATKKMASVVLALGAPGTGKGTHSKFISQNFNFVHLGAGDLLRAEIKRNSPNSEMIQRMIREGEIVPAEVTIELILAEIKANMSKQNSLFILDGFPRNKRNREIWDKMAKKEADILAVLVFECPEKVIAERILSRGKISARTDDNKDSIAKRMVTFNEDSLPVIKHYEALGIVRRISTDREIEEVFKAVKTIFDDLKENHKF